MDMCSFHLLAIVNNVAMTLFYKLFVWVPVFNSSDFIPGNEIVRSCGFSNFNFLKTPKVFVIVVVPIYLPISNVQGSSFSTSLWNHAIFQFFEGGGIIAILVCVKWHLCILCVFCGLTNIFFYFYFFILFFHLFLLVGG